MFQSSGNVSNAYCSWCFQKTAHTELEKRLVTRNLYTCENCVRKTLKCRHPTCTAMARSLPDWDEELCYVHRKIITSWEDREQIQKLNPSGYCSWCYELTTHMNIQRNVVRKHLYECLKCNRPTKKCERCPQFGRDRGISGSSICAQCNGSVTDWKDVDANKASLQKEAWCSFCYDLTVHFKITGQKYNCTGCSQDTFACSSCSDGMCQTESTIGGNSCQRCKMERKKSGSWNSLQEVISRLKEDAEDGSYIEKNLRRDSEFKKKAIETGTIRPFLFLASMHPSMRIKVGILLGIDIPSFENFGDAHAESWLLIDKDRHGIQARTNKTTETLNALGRDSDWYDTMIRVGNMTKSFEKFSGITGMRKRKVCSDSSEMFLCSFECEYLESLAQYQRQKIPAALNQRIEEILSKEGAQKLTEKLAIAGIVNHPNLVRFLVETSIIATNEVDFEITSEDAYARLDAEALVSILQEQMFSKGYFLSVARAQKIASVLGNVAFGRVVGTFFPILGLLNMAGNILNAVFGSTIEKLQLPVSMILTHELLLASRGISINKYY